MTVRPFCNRSFWTRIVFLCAMGRLELSIGVLALRIVQLRFHCVVGLLVKLHTSIDTCFNFMLVASRSPN